jgi:peptide/nickel transport system permease protein
MLVFLGRRLLLAIPSLFGVALVTFVLMRSVPGDVVTQLVGVLEDISPERLAELRRLFGLDLPVHVQFAQWLGAVLQGDLGTSLRTGRSVALDIGLRFPVTLQLTLMSLGIALVLAVPLGVTAARYRGRWPDYLGSAFVLVGLAIPNFFLAILLILLFSLRLGWLPPAGYVPFMEDPLENMRRMVLPSLSLGLILAAATTRIMRSTMLEVLGRDYVRTARAKGLVERRVVLRHALRNALIPVVTVVGLQFGALLGGAVIVEQVFSLPGIGRFALEGINLRDYPVVQGAVLVIAAAFVLVNLLVDVVYALIDPRVRYG